ncbi:MAG: isoprenylcysteine carboxylmethyltransferase family protein [Candidatus Atribacteria bacterium]|nr:isoprenylcysteine carboxylmethyltransferase family protein [Candidatus Atribacteria bacterium]
MKRSFSESTEKLGAFLFPYRGIIWGIIGLLVFLFAQVKTTLFIAGLFILVIGEIFRIWGVGYIKNYRGPMTEATELTTAGPYAFVRNPLYLANGIIGTGISLLSGYIFMIPLFYLLFFLLYHPIIYTEEQFLTTKFKEEYLNYQQKVPRYLPVFHPYPHSMGTFSWDVILIKEINTITTLLILSILFYLRGYGFLRVLDRFFLGF